MASLRPGRLVDRRAAVGCWRGQRGGLQPQDRHRRLSRLLGLEVLDTIRSAPFDLRIALPDEAGPTVSLAPADDGSEKPR